jgi:hypothetical protein
VVAEVLSKVALQAFGMRRFEIILKKYIYIYYTVIYITVFDLILFR